MEEASLGTVAEPLLVSAIRGKKVERAPIWLLRQAGRYMKMARTQKNKATAHHLGLLKQKGVNILKQEGVKFGSFDILTDNDVREVVN
eukprot:XP_020404124.1 uncharacterized protein LOC103649219 [Zea mays]